MRTAAVATAPTIIVMMARGVPPIRIVRPVRSAITRPIVRAPDWRPIPVGIVVPTPHRLIVSVRMLTTLNDQHFTGSTAAHEKSRQGHEQDHESLVHFCTPVVVNQVYIPTRYTNFVNNSLPYKIKLTSVRSNKVYQTLTWGLLRQ